MTSRLNRRSAGEILLQVPTAIVLTAIVLFYAFVVRARLALGNWPEVYRPDPKDLGFSLHLMAVGVGLWVAIHAAYLIIPAALAAAVLGVPRFRCAVSAVVFLVCYALGYVLLRNDYGNFVNWYLD